MDTRSDIFDSRYSWLRLVMTLGVAIIANAGMWIVIAVLPDIESDFGVSRGLASAPYTMTMIGFAIGNFAVGRLVDRFGVAISLQAAAVVIAASYVLSTLSPGIILLSVVHLFLGLGTAVGFGPLIADISHWFYRQRGLAVALVASGNYLSGVVWPLLLSDTMASGDWRGVYLTLAAVAVCGMIPMSLTLRRGVPDSARSIATQAAAQRSGSLGLSPRKLAFLLGAAGIFCCVAMSMPQVHIVAYCIGLGYGPTSGYQMLSLMLLGGVVSRIVSGLVADRLGGVITLLIGSTLQCIALFLYLPYDGLVSLYVVSMIFGLSQGGIVPSYAVIVREYMPAKDAGTWVGFVLMTTILGMALGGQMSAWIYDATGSYQAAFVNGIVWNGMNIAIMAWLLLRTRSRPPVLMSA